MAECHPVGFQWVMEAKKRGARVIHVDPRFTRTSALADLHVPIRAGADIAFVGGLINYVLQNEKYFRDYVVAYTNAATILTEDYATPRTSAACFPALTATTGCTTWIPGGMRVERYDQPVGERSPAATRGPLPADQLRQVRGAARGETHGEGGAACTSRSLRRDETLQHPRCVFQVLKRHFARYTPEMVAEVAGVPEEQFLQVARLITENSGRDRTTAFVYSLGWTQHTVGVQYIRTAAILQTLLGNMGRPGGGIVSCAGTPRSRARPISRPCSTCCPATSLMPHAYGNEGPRHLRRRPRSGEGVLGQYAKYLVSLLKA